MLAACAFNHSFFLYIPNTVPTGGGQKGLNLTVTSCNLITGRINSSPAQRSVPLVHHRVVIAWFPAAFLFLTSAITPHVIKEILKVLLVSYDFWNDTEDAAVDCPLPPSPARFDTEPPDRLFEPVFRRVETKVAEPRQYFTATLPTLP